MKAIVNHEYGPPGTQQQQGQRSLDGKFPAPRGPSARGVTVRAQRLRPFAATEKREELVALKELIESGKVTPVIDRTYSLNEVAEALSHYGTGHARGKVIITMEQNEAQERGD